MHIQGGENKCGREACSLDGDVAKCMTDCAADSTVAFNHNHVSVMALATHVCGSSFHAVRFWSLGAAVPAYN